MTLVVAQTFANEIRIVGDTLQSSTQDLHQTLLDGVLKVILVTSACCVCYSGSIFVAEAAIRPLLLAPGNDRRAIVSHLLEQHRTHGQATDFLVVFSDTPHDVCRISDGTAISGLPAAWIGDRYAFERFQTLYHANCNELAESNADDKWSRWASKLPGTMAAVISDSSIPSVGGFVVTVTSEPAQRDGLRYLGRMFGDGFKEVALASFSKSLLRPLGPAGGGYRYNMLVPSVAGVGAIAIHIPEAAIGVLFHPAEAWSPLRFPNVQQQQFVHQVAGVHGISLQGLDWPAEA